MKLKFAYSNFQRPINANDINYHLHLNTAIPPLNS